MKIYITEIKQRNEGDFKHLGNEAYKSLEDARHSLQNETNLKKLDTERFENHIEFYESSNGLFTHRITELELV